MKTTNRIHKNGATKPASVQIKTVSAQPAPQTDRFAVRDAIDLLREAQASSLAMQMLLADVLTKTHESRYGEQLDYGISLLIQSTSRRMDRAVEAATALIEIKPEVAS